MRTDLIQYAYQATKQERRRPCFNNGYYVEKIERGHCRSLTEKFQPKPS